MSVTPSTPLVGRTLGHYRFLSLIGEGGTGQVYLAHDEHLHRDVAVKVLSPGLLADEQARHRFRSEALTLSQLNHPNIATIHDFEAVGERDLLVLEYVAGETLSERIARKPLAEEEIARLGTQLAQGLAAAHARGIIHRDLKPSNLRITPDGFLKIIDYGLARLAPAQLTDLSTRTGSVADSVVAGTPGYMAPEQLLGESPDGRADLYAVGTILYEMATSRRPYSANNLFELVNQVVHTAPPPPRTINPGISIDLEHVILKLLDRSPGLRYQRAEDLAVDLRRLGRGTKVRPAAWRRRGVALSTLAVLAVVVPWLAWHDSPPPDAAFGARDWVLVADVRDTTDGSALAVREALTLTLQQSRYVNVLPRERVVAALQRMERPTDAGLDEATALDLCRRENAKVLLTPSVQAAGQSSSVIMRGLDANGRLLFVERARIQPGGDMLAAVDAVAARVRKALGESLDQIAASRPLAQVTTPSLEALERYSRGVDQAARGELTDAEGSLSAALVADPGFAMAHFQLARVHLRLGHRDGEREHLEAAYVDRSRLSDRERYLIEAAYAEHRDEFEQSERSLRTLVGLFPDDPIGRYELGQGFVATGKLPEAAEQFAAALRLDPHLAPAYSELALVLGEDSRDSEALEVVGQARARGLDTPNLRWAQGMALFGLGRLDDARRVFEAMAASSEESERVLGDIYLTRLLIFKGQFAAASEKLEQAIRADRFAGRSYPERIRRYLLGRLALLRGDRRGAVRQASEMVKGPDVRVEHLWHAGYLHVLADDLSAATDALAQLTALVAEHPDAFGRSCVLHLEGEIAVRRGRDGAELLRQSDAAFPNTYALIRLADLAERRKDWRAAITAWTRVAEARGSILRNGFAADYVVAAWRRASNHVRVGEVQEAKLEYQRVIEIWQNGDDTTDRRRVRDELDQLSVRRTP